jgi:hypothetical protein
MKALAHMDAPMLILPSDSRIFESQFSPNGLKFKPANFAQALEWIITITVKGPELNLLGRQIRFPVSVDDCSYDFLSRRQYFWRGTQPNATQERIHRNQISRVANQIFWVVCIMLRSVDEEACTFTDKIGIQSLSEDEYFSQQFASILMPLRYPSA